MLEQDYPTRYDASITEQKWYRAWEDAGLFQPETASTKEKFVITIPPPNITGSLHMGHALCYGIQDMIGRYQRLRGRNVLVLPGQDHAGIATQSVVLKQVRKEGINPLEMGRDKFVERVWEWRKESGDTIIDQFRRFGCAFDWSRLRFTLDDRYHEAVLKVFIDWFERGVIYRGKRVVNWDPVLKTSVSDIETERKVVKGKLYYIRYPYADGSGEVVIATTRPETMLADVAVAVHPSDARYKDKVGRNLILPLMNREVPIIADIYPDPEFGSGAVKITPAHDPNDYEVGIRHKLEMPVVLDESARVNENGGAYAGLDRYEARKRIVADLEEQGYLVKVEDHEIALMVSERSGEVIEPLLSLEWFARQTELAQPAIDAVRQGRVEFVPERYNRIFLDWMENIRDWNISRRLWWGHRIPVYYTEDGTPFAALSWEEAQAKAGDAKIVRQDDDVLDTWFSSGLWPFATLGWPEQTSDLKEFYPTSLMVTAQEILYLWVARMIMMGIDFAGDIPFSEVYIYATVLTEDGRRMSKSLGTGVDPMTVIDSRGADALRFTLFSQTGHNQDIRYSERRTEDARNFCNKIWNAVRFVLLNVESMPDRPTHLDDVDQWLLSRLYVTEKSVTEAFDAYDNQAAAHALYRFFWSELCDWYIEVAKPRLNDPSQRATPQWVLLTCIEAFLTMMHPFMPHITEEVYSRLPIPSKAPFLMQAKWPELDSGFHQPEVETRVERIFEVTRAFRALRAELGLPAIKAIPVAFYEGDLGGAEIVRTQAWIESLQQGKPAGEKFVSTTVEGVDLHIPLGDLVDPEKEVLRLEREMEKVTADLQKLEARLANPDFVSRAKPEVIERDRSQADDLRTKLEKTRERLRLFSG